jgi:glutamine amidotransferase
VIAIIDYNAGNLKSVAKMLDHLGCASRFASTPRDLTGVDKIILPGVGKFDYGMTNLRQRGFVEALGERVLRDRMPILGICLGLQLLTRGSEEGVGPGLGWIAADTVAFDRTLLKNNERVPHMGWTDTAFKRESRLFHGVEGIPRYYYVHSFHLRCDLLEDELCHADHGYLFPSGIERDNIIGIQFHPEKSHNFGMQLLKNFIELY